MPGSLTDDREPGELGPAQEPVEPAGRTLAARKRLLVIVVAAVVALTAAAVVAATRIKSAAQVAAETEAPPPSVITAPVERKVLTDTVVTRGTVTAEQSLDVVARAPDDTGTAVVTGVDVHVGDLVQPGARVAEVSGRPVFVLPGAIPTYRDLRPGSEGRDVQQLQDVLRQLGYAQRDRAGFYGEGTKQAVTRFYQAKGYTPRPAGADDDEALESAGQAVTMADRALRDARTALSAAQQTGTGVAAAKLAVSDREADLKHAQDQLAKVRERTGPMVPAGEVVFLSALPARVDGVYAQIGTQPKDRILTLSAGRLVVRGELSPFQMGLVKAGQPAQILAGATGTTADGTVQSVSEAPAQPSGNTGDNNQNQNPATQQYALVVVPAGQLDPKLAGQNVRITVTAASSGDPVLVVPLAAVSAAADGKTTVTVVDGPDRRRVEVAAGVSGQGFVQVTPIGGGRLDEGERVLVGG